MQPRACPVELGNWPIGPTGLRMRMRRRMWRRKIKLGVPETFQCALTVLVHIYVRTSSFQPIDGGQCRLMVGQLQACYTELLLYITLLYKYT